MLRLTSREYKYFHPTSTGPPVHWPRLIFSTFIVQPQSHAHPRLPFKLQLSNANIAIDQIALQLSASIIAFFEATWKKNETKRNETTSSHERKQDNNGPIRLIHFNFFMFLLSFINHTANGLDRVPTDRDPAVRPSIFPLGSVCFLKCAGTGQQCLRFSFSYLFFFVWPYWQSIPNRGET